MKIWSGLPKHVRLVSRMRNSNKNKLKCFSARTCYILYGFRSAILKHLSVMMWFVLIIMSFWDEVMGFFETTTFLTTLWSLK
jgi:hypothetical protein